MIEIVDSNPSAAEQARLWVIKMDGGELSHSDRSRLREWLRFSPENRAALREARRLWASLDDWTAQMQRDSAAPAQLAALVRAEDPVAPAWTSLAGRWLRPNTALAATVVLGLFVLGLLQFAPPPDGRYETGPGEMLSRQLEDGSTITLNTRTSVDVVFSATERHIVLRRGEGFFNVAKDPQRPFVVYAAGGSVAAIGTAFNVRKLDDLVAVTVAEGIVEVSTGGVPSAPATTRQVSANQVLRYGNELGVPAQRELQEVERSLAWRSGKLHFDDIALEAFLLEVNRYSDNQLLVVDADLEQIRVGGVFTAGDSDGILKALQASFAMESVGLTPNLTLLYRKEGE